MTNEDSLFGLSERERNRLLRRMSRKRTTSPIHTSEPSRVGRPSFEDLPGYDRLRMQAEAAEALQLTNPFFRQHEGVASATTVVEGRRVVNFASYNYLDLNGHPTVCRAAKAAVDRYGTSVSASRMVSGERPLLRELERALARLYNVADCVVFVSGHATNVTTIGHMMSPRDLIVHDAAAHNSIVQGALLSRAHRLTFAHNDPDAADRILTNNRADFDRALLVIEGHYSMDGDVPPLRRFVDVKDRHDAFLMVDEAHSLGVLGHRGHGLAEHHGVDPRSVDIWMGTLSKSLAGCGGFIAGPAALVDYLKLSAPGFVYSVGLAPPLAAASLAALEVMESEPERVASLRDRGSRFLQAARDARLDTGTSSGHSIVPVIVGRSTVAVRLSDALLERGINVQPIIHPAVPERAARLRFFLSCAHTEEQILDSVTATAAELARLLRT